MTAEKSATFLTDSNEFITKVMDVWQHGFMGIDVGRIIIALAIFTFAMMVRGLFSKYVLYKLQQYAEKSSTQVDDRIIIALIPPVRFIPLILGLFFAGKYLDLGGDLEIFFDRIIRSMIAFTIFWGLFRAVHPISKGFRRLEKALSPMMVNWIFRALRILVVFIGGAVILEMWGIKVGPLLAGLGLFGAAVALGAQDLFKNLIGGITVIAEKRFSPGDWICVDGVVEGTVEDIGFRSTKIRRFDRAPVHVPNAQLSDTVVTNFTRMTHRRIRWAIGVEYRTTTQQLKTIRDEILNYIENADELAKDEVLSTYVRVDNFGASSIDFIVNCFSKKTDIHSWLEAKESMAFAIKDIVENKAKTGFAFPSQSIYIEGVSGDASEMFVPPGAKSGT